MTRWIVFGCGVALGLLAFALWIVRPSDRDLSFPLLLLSFALTADRPSSKSGSTKDVSTPALVIAFSAVALLFLLFLIPNTFWHGFWSRIDALTPESARTLVRNGPPLWVRIGLALLWAMVMCRRFVRHNGQPQSSSERVSRNARSSARS